MTKEEAKAFLIGISHDLGTVGAEFLSVKDGKKMRDAIETLSAEPQKMGRWILTPHGERCSECLEEERSLKPYGWCPNCGAKMLKGAFE